MISAITNKLKSIFGGNSHVMLPAKRPLEQGSGDTGDDEASDEVVDQPARKRSRHTVDDPVKRSRANPWRHNFPSIPWMFAKEPTSNKENIQEPPEKMKLRQKSSRRQEAGQAGVVLGDPSQAVSLPPETPSNPPTSDDEVQFVCEQRSSSRGGDGGGGSTRVTPTLSRARRSNDLGSPTPAINPEFRFSATTTTSFPPTPSITIKELRPDTPYLSSSMYRPQRGHTYVVPPWKKSSTPISRLPMRPLPVKLLSSSAYKKKSSTHYLFRRGRSGAEESYRFEDKARYQQLLHQYSNPNLFSTTSSPTNKLSSYFSPNVSTRGMMDPMVVRTKLSTAQTDQKRRQLEESLGEGRTSHSSTINLFSSPVSQVSSGQESPIELPVVDISRPDSSTPCSTLSQESDSGSVVVVKEVIKTKPRRNSLEEKLDGNPVVSPDWLKNLHEKYRSREATVEGAKQHASELVKKLEHRRKLTNLVDEQVTRSMKCLDLTYPQKYEEVTLEEEKEEEEEEVALVELTPEIEDVVDSAFHRCPRNKVLVEKFNIQIKGHDISTLAGLNWLNDEVINFYMNLIMERSRNDNYPSVYAFNTFFYPKLVKTQFQSVKRWTKKVDIFSQDLLLVPVHLGMHWCLATVDFGDKCIRYYDSMLGNNDQCLRTLLRYLEEEHLDKKKTSYSSSDWRLETLKDIPQQMNGSDCGMFACKFAEYVSRRARITFEQEHMPYFRRRMAYEIIKAKLL